MGAHMIRHYLPTVVEHSNFNMQLLGRLQIGCEIQIQALL